MSSQITTAFVKQYKDLLFHLSQQKGSRLRGAVRNEMQKGSEAFYERLGKVTAVEKTSRHSDTPLIDTPHSRRRVTLTDYEYADLIDDQDKIRTLIDPESPYLQAQVFAMGRAMDEKIINQALGNAYSGVDGSTAVGLGDSQRLAAVNDAGNAGANMNVEVLRRAKEILDANDVDEMIPRYCAINASALQSLLAETEVTSSDYNVVKALVQGQVDTFLGFKFIRLELLPATSLTSSFSYTDGSVGSGSGTLDSTYKSMIAWAQDGLLLSIGKDIETKISERADKSYANQVYSRMSIGATRLEEEKVVEIFCKQS